MASNVGTAMATTMTTGMKVQRISRRELPCVWTASAPSCSLNIREKASVSAMTPTKTAPASQKTST